MPEYPHSRSTYPDLAGGNTAVHATISDAAFIAAIVEFETALAHAAHQVGIIDAAAHTQAIELLEAYQPDTAAVAEDAIGGANPVIEMVKAIKQGVPAPGIHVGATSQDALDTALVLCLRRGSGVLKQQLHNTMQVLVELARQHQHTPIMGRTLGQAAQPMTFGLIIAGWAEGLYDASLELSRAASALPLQYGGATGTWAAVHPHGQELHAQLAKELQLPTVPLIWHSNRMPFARLAAAYAGVAGSLRKIAGDITFLSATEVGELQEATPGGSSAMPHKANPAAAIAADGYARRAPGLLATMYDALDCRLQRGVGSWHAEWSTLRELLAVTASALARVHASVDGIVVHSAQMQANMRNTADAGHSAQLCQLILDRIVNDKEEPSHE